MKERPILFSGPMVRAILDGRKTQTRRPVKPQPFVATTSMFDISKCPLGQPGDRLWVRETWRKDALGTVVEYRATTSALMEFIAPWRPSIHMPRWASRITLEITRVWVERVQDITEDEAKAEGIVDGGCMTCGKPETCGCQNPRPDRRDSFANLWQSIYGTWDANPWVWAVEFRRVK